MKKSMMFFAALFFLTLGGNQAVWAVARNWEVDKDHSNFYFSVDHIFSKIKGTFADYTSEVRFDPSDLAGSRFYFAIETDSIDTRIAKRDKHLRSADFFDSGRFPLMTFESTRITDLGNGRYEVLGKFTVKGVDYELVLPLTLAGIKDHPAVKGKEVAGFNGQVELDRLAYKVGTGKFYNLGLAGKDVEVFVSLEMLSDK